MEQKLNKNKLVTSPLFIVGLAVTVFFVGSFYASHNQDKEVGSMLKQSLDGNFDAKNKGMDVVMARVFASYKESNQKLFPYSLKLETSDILEYSSFKTKEKLTSSMDIIKGSLEEYSEYNSKFEIMLSNARQVITESELSDKDKSEMLKGFNESQKTNATAREKMVTTQIAFHEKVLSLYEFLLANFDDYKIQTDTNGEESIAFYSERNITRYNQISTEIQTLAQEATSARTVLSSKLNGVSDNDIQNYIKK